MNGFGILGLMAMPVKHEGISEDKTRKEPFVFRSGHAWANLAGNHGRLDPT